MGPEHPDWPKCACGCGEPTWAAPKTRNDRGWVRGEPLKYARNHHPGRLSAQAPRPVDYEVDELSGCWNWRRWKTPKGYGRFKEGGKARRAHVEYYERHKGPVPDGHDLHHICGNRGCVNPEHLVALDPTDHAGLPRRGWVPRGEYVRVVRLLEAAGIEAYLSPRRPVDPVPAAPVRSTEPQPDLVPAGLFSRTVVDDDEWPPPEPED